MTRAQAIKKLSTNVRRFKRKVGATSVLVCSDLAAETFVQVGPRLPSVIRGRLGSSVPEAGCTTLYFPSFPRVFVATLNASVFLVLVLRSERQEPRAWLGYRHRARLLACLANVLGPSDPAPPPDLVGAAAFGPRRGSSVRHAVRAVGLPAVIRGQPNTRFNRTRYARRLT